MKSNIPKTSKTDRIMDEFVRGFEFTSKIGKAAAIFGSSRSVYRNYHYQEARKLASLLVKEKFAVVTGGGPGIMEAANRGAMEAKGKSIGLNIKLPYPQRTNKFVTRSMDFNYFFVRKVMFASACEAYLFFPGGFGTLDEFFEMVNLIKTQKLYRPPLMILIGKDYWQPLISWFFENLYIKHKTIDKGDFKNFHLADSAQEALEIVKKHIK